MTTARRYSPSVTAKNSTYDYTGEGNAILLLTEKSEKYVSYTIRISALIPPNATLFWKKDTPDHLMVCTTSFSRTSKQWRMCLFFLCRRFGKTILIPFPVPVSDLTKGGPKTADISGPISSEELRYSDISALRAKLGLMKDRKS